MKEREWLVSALAAAIGLLLVAAVVAALNVDRAGSATDHQTVALAPTAPAAPSTTLTTAPATTLPAPARPQAWAVGDATYTFVDRSRPTEPAGSDPGEPFRNLPTIVRYPAVGQPSPAESPGAAADRKNGPFPLIVFAHGYNASPTTYAGLLHAWAAAGYVVAAPAFPRATAGGPLDENDVVHQPADVSFVLTQLLGLSRAGKPLAGVIDSSRLAVAGHSDGGSTAVGIGYSDCCHDSRLRADVVMEGDDHTFGIGHPAGPVPALLVIQGDSDTTNPPDFGVQVFSDGPAPKFFLTLIHGQHLEPFTTDQPHLRVVEATTVAFFDRYLKNSADGGDRMRVAATAGLATLRAG